MRKIMPGGKRSRPKQNYVIVSVAKPSRPCGLLNRRLIFFSRLTAQYYVCAACRVEDLIMYTEYGTSLLYPIIGLTISCDFCTCKNVHIENAKRTHPQHLAFAI